MVGSDSDNTESSDGCHSPGNNHTRITLIMPVHGPLSSSAPALRAVGALSPAPEQIVVVTDVSSGADDSTVLPAGALTVTVPYASGPARARNAGVAAAKGQILLFVDADVVVPSDTVQRVTEEFARYPGVAAIFGSYDTTPSDPDFLSQYRNLMHHFVHQSAHEVAGTFWAGLGAIRTEAFLSVGGFNVSYGVPSIEDIEFGGRLRDAGGEIRLVKSLQGCHLKRWTAVGMLTTDLWQRGVPWVRLILARGAAPSDLNTGQASRWSTLLTWSGVALLPWGMRSIELAGIALAALSGVVALNLPFYRFLAQQRGVGFALRSIPWHLLYYLECGLAGIIGSLLHCRDWSLNRRARYS